MNNVLEKKIKYSVIGTGKTGGTVAGHLDGLAICFDEFNRPTPEKLKETDVAIVFVPGSAAEQVVNIVLEAGIPAVWGTTGYQWPEDLPEKVKDADTRWIIGSNFSLGMNLIRKAIQIFGKGSEMLKAPQFHIHEVHHVQKQDAPSGTALSWKEWLGREAVISSDRQGDVKGIHNLHIKTEGESIYLKHEAHSRSVFAEGAIWTANYLLNNPGITPGVYQFSDIFDRAYSELL
jgi:4-hydroxy-tetrahydrodipicolinate reductase